MVRRDGRLAAGCVLLLLLAVIGAALGIGMLYESKRPNGECLGLDDTSRRLRGVEYEISTGNAIVMLVTIESLVIPVYIALTSIYCPVVPQPKVVP